MVCFVLRNVDDDGVQGAVGGYKRRGSVEAASKWSLLKAEKTRTVCIVK